MPAGTAGRCSRGGRLKPEIIIVIKYSRQAISQPVIPAPAAARKAECSSPSQPLGRVPPPRGSSPGGTALYLPPGPPGVRRLSASGPGKFRRRQGDGASFTHPPPPSPGGEGGILVDGNEEGTLWQPARPKAKHKHNSKSPQFVNTASLFSRCSLPE